MAIENNETVTRETIPQPAFLSVPEFGAPTPQIFPSFSADEIFVSNTTTFFNNFKHSFKEDTIFGNIYTIAAQKEREIFTPTPLLGEERLNELNKKFPGIDLKENVTEGMADLLVKRFIDNKKFERIAASANPTWGGWLSAFAGSFFASIADPASLAGAALAPELFGIKKIETAISLSDAALTRTIRGTIEGGAFGVITETGKKGRSVVLDEEYDGIQGLINIATDGALGGLFYTLGGLAFDKLSPTQRARFAKGVGPISEEAGDELNNIAISQVLNGTDVNLEVPLKQTMANEAERLFNELEVDPLNNGTKSLDNLLEALDTGHEKVTTKLDNNLLELDAIQGEIKEKGETGELLEKLGGLEKENIDLTLQDKSYQVMKLFFEDKPKNVTQADLDNYIKDMRSIKGAFKHSGPEDLLESPGKIENVTGLLEEFFPDNYVESLKRNVPLDEIDNVAFEEIKVGKKKLSKFQRMIDTAVDCLTGA